MGKGTNNSGIPVFAEVIKLLDKQKINKIADIHKANRYTKRFDAYQHTQHTRAFVQRRPCFFLCYGVNNYLCTVFGIYR